MAEVKNKKILLIGSGPSIIGQGAEFDYSGTQAAKELKALGHEVVVLNSNPASILTDSTTADEIYIEAMTLENVISIVRKEKINAVLGNFGGQTALNMVLEMDKKDVFNRYNLELLSHPIHTIKKAEDREMFRDLLDSIGEPYVESQIITTAQQAKQAKTTLGLPLIVRPAFTLGGTGGGRCKTDEDYQEIVKQGLALSPLNQCLVERDISGLKEIEFEMIRDKTGAILPVCTLENFDPVGIHTGDSIVFTPAQTITHEQEMMLETSAIKIVDALGIIGSCNVQFALNPLTNQYYVIEVNPRVSRSSALASKVSDYPIASVAAQLSVGMTLSEIKQPHSKEKNYVACKMPRFPFDKFKKGDRRLGTQMKSTGEIMAFGRTLEECMYKGLASLELNDVDFKGYSDYDLLSNIEQGSDDRIYQMIELLRRGGSVEELSIRTSIDLKLIESLQKMVKKQAYYEATTPQFAAINEKTFYSFASDSKAGKKKQSNKKVIVVIGSGPIRIGQGMEFDTSSVQAVQSIQEQGYEAVIINNNPATVSTDKDIADRLYFEPLTPKHVLDVLNYEQPEGVIVQFGGQTAINLVETLSDHNIKILGTQADQMNRAEDRESFEKLLRKLNIKQPEAHIAHNQEDYLSLADRLNYPVLIRPSFVIGGASMKIIKTKEDYLVEHSELSFNKPVLIDRYISGIELDLDVISDGKNILIPGLMEHIEKSGVHSGDSMAVYPSVSLDETRQQEIVDISRKIARELKIKGLMNIQMIVQDQEIYVIEVNPRASRTIPFISKASGIDVSKLATRIAMGECLDKDYGLIKAQAGIHIKAPIFSFSKLRSVDTYLGPEMKSTGEIMSSAPTLEKALFKAFLSSGYTFKETGSVLLTIADKDKDEMLHLAKTIESLDYDLLASKNTHNYLKEHGIKSQLISKWDESNHDMKWAIESLDLNFIVNTVSDETKSFSDGFLIRRTAVEKGVPLFTSIDTARALVKVLESRSSKPWKLGGQ
ncbi:carbamoyl-phosphate synthase large subunit [Erysipelothrix urinaevulpis]|uniref:carbamoyl-phosphate synthase large subunit n=1 Tax=Erysipelothrix urinaevulpis TaxID=2683717 RepID=UPI00135B7038|nr:carbamoyl-phosphate synthase large subunit [Erysipelothrix urinaevulpis]